MPRSFATPRRFPYPRPGPWILAALGIAVFACLVGWALSLTEVDAWFFVENGPIELVECAFLALAIVPMSVASLRSDGWSALACAVLVIVIALMIVRETPRCDGPFAEKGLCIAASYKNLLYAAIPILVFAIHALLKKPLALLKGRFDLPAIILEVLWTWPLVVVAGLLLLAQAAEAYHWQEMEEMLELASYFCFGLLGVWAMRHVASFSGDGSAALPESRLGHLGLCLK